MRKAGEEEGGWLPVLGILLVPQLDSTPLKSNQCLTSLQTRRAESSTGVDTRVVHER